MGERQLLPNTYDHQDVRAVTTLGADGAPLDGPEIIAGAPISRPAAEVVYGSKPGVATDFGLKTQPAAK